MHFMRSRISKLGLWPRMALAISAGFIILFLAFALLGERALRDSKDRLIEERLVIAQITAGQIDRLLEQAFFALEQAVQDTESEPDGSILSALANSLEAKAELALFSPGLILVDDKGQVTSSHPTELYPAGSDLSGLPYISQALAMEQTTISEPFLDPMNGQSVVAIATPLFERNQLIGLLIGLISLGGKDVMTPLVQATGLLESEHAALVDNQGRVVVSTFGLPPLSLGEHYHFYRRAMAGGISVVETVPFELDLPGEPEGHMHVMALVPLKNASWGLSVGGDEADIFAGFQSLRLGLVLLGVAALTGVWILTLVGARRVVRPVQQLTQAAYEIADGNLKVGFQTSEGGEIGVMSAALDRMRNQMLADMKDLAEWNQTLEERVAEQTADLRQQQILTQQLLGEVIDAQERERSRLARELHDEIGQTLTAIELSLGHLANALLPENEEARQRLKQSRTLIEQTTTDLRTIIAALRPGVLDQLGLVPALEWISDHTLRPKGVSVTIEDKGLDGRLPSEIETTLFRIAQETMNNVGRHSQATSLDILLLVEPGEVMMTLSDDGKGLVDKPSIDDKDYGRGMGIVGMKERADLAGGELLIESVTDKGTTVRVTIPIITGDEEGVAMLSQPIRLIVVDDHAIMREGLVKLLEHEPDLHIVGLASTGREAIELANKETVDLILLDIVMDDMTGLEAARQILANSPEVKIIMLTMYEEEAFLQEALQAGASGYFLKGSNSNELINTIRNVHRGDTYLSPKMAHRLDESFPKSQDQAPAQNTPTSDSATEAGQ